MGDHRLEERPGPPGLDVGSIGMTNGEPLELEGEHIAREHGHPEIGKRPQESEACRGPVVELASPVPGRQGAEQGTQQESNHDGSSGKKQGPCHPRPNHIENGLWEIGDGGSQLALEQAF